MAPRLIGDFFFALVVPSIYVGRPLVSIFSYFTFFFFWLQEAMLRPTSSNVLLNSSVQTSIKLFLWPRPVQGPFSIFFLTPILKSPPIRRPTPFLLQDQVILACFIRSPDLFAEFSDPLYL